MSSPRDRLDKTKYTANCKCGKECPIFRDDGDDFVFHLECHQCGYSSSLVVYENERGKLPPRGQ